ncbi:MAG: nitroreductase family protein [Leptospiraceae bacterium]|nr:nitroreductase family protein [Leptospiraceae bacterium]
MVQKPAFGPRQIQMELKEAIQRRRTTNRAFLKKPVSEEHIRELIYAANRAPSHFNSQPWDFILIQDREMRNKIGDIAADSMKQLIGKGDFFKRYQKYFRFGKKEIENDKSGIHVDRIPAPLRPFISKVFGPTGIKVMNSLKVPSILGRDQGKIVRESPLLLAFMLKKSEYRPGEKSGIYSLISMGAALENLWLTATSLGMGIQFVSTPMEVPQNWQKILKLLAVPDSHELMAIYRLGYTSESIKRPTIDWVSDQRREFEDLVSFEFFGNRSRPQAGK